MDYSVRAGQFPLRHQAPSIVKNSQCWPNPPLDRHLLICRAMPSTATTVGILNVSVALVLAACAGNSNFSTPAATSNPDIGLPAFSDGSLSQPDTGSLPSDADGTTPDTGTTPMFDATADARPIPPSPDAWPFADTVPPGDLLPELDSQRSSDRDVQPDTEPDPGPLKLQSPAANRLVVSGATDCVQGISQHVSGAGSKWTPWVELAGRSEWRREGRFFVGDMSPHVGTRVWHLIVRDLCRQPPAQADVWIDCKESCRALRPPSQPDDTDYSLPTGPLVAGVIDEQVHVVNASACLHGNAQRVSGSRQVDAWTDWVAMRHNSDWRRSDSKWSADLAPHANSGHWLMLFHDPCQRRSGHLWLDCEDTCRKIPPPPTGQ